MIEEVFKKKKETYLKFKKQKKHTKFVTYKKIKSKNKNKQKT